VYSSYLDARGYAATKIPEASGKTPDLEVTGNRGRYLNEVKSPELLLDAEIGLFKFTTTNSKLLQFLHKAIKQFAAYDPAHATPWVITFASAHFQLNWHSLFEAMHGGSVVEGKVIADWTKTTVFRRWAEERYVVDLYVWLQVHEERGPYQACFFTNARSNHRPLIDQFVADLRAVPLSEMDRSLLLV